MANEKSIEARHQLEYDFIQAAFSGLVYNTVKIDDLYAICPPHMLIENGLAQTVYKACYAVKDDQGKVGLDDVYLYLKKQGCLKRSDISFNIQEITPEFMGKLMMSNFGMSFDAIVHIAKAMRNEGVKRNAEAALYSLISECQNFANDAQDIAQRLNEIYIEMISGGGMEESNDLAELMDRTKKSMLPDFDSKPLPLPYENINKVLKGGFAPGELVILAARPGVGKTALAGCISIEMARAGIQTLFISREVKDITIGQRLVAREGHFDVSYFRYKNEFDDRLYYDACAAADSIAALPLKIREKSIAPMTPNEIRRIAKNTPNVGFIVVDYLQLLNPDTKQNSREREVADMSRSMKQLALDCNCPVLLLSQLNRDVTKTEREPMLSDLRESGAIEQDADIVMFLHAKKDEEKDDVMPLKAIIAKSRSSGTGAAYLTYEKRYCDFKVDALGEVWDKNNKSKNANWDM